MATNTTNLLIANLALAHLGQQEISALTDATPEAEACNRYFTPCRDEVLREIAWSFASAPIVLDSHLSINDTSIPGWSCFYTYPSSTITVWHVYSSANAASAHEQDFSIRYLPALGTKIICSDESDAYADVSYLVTDPSLWDDKFIKAFSYRLAASIAKIITGDEDLGIKMMNLYNFMIHDAKKISAREKRKKPVQTSNYVESRG